MNLIVYILVPTFCPIMKLIKNKDLADKPTNFDAIRTSNTNCANASDKEKCFLRNLKCFDRICNQQKTYGR